MRGGTSRGLIIKDIDLPLDPQTREEVIIKIYGSSKYGQINGIGGGTSLTSKLAIIGKSDKEDCDINYTFGQVSTTNKKIDYNVTCGNMASAVGLYAVEEGLVRRHETSTKVRIFNTNTGKKMEVDVPVSQGEVVTEGNYSMDGVSETGSKITVNFVEPEGSFTNKLFPTGAKTNIIETDDGRVFNVSILDTGNIVVFVKASDFSLYGDELSNTLNDSVISEDIEKLRVKAGILLGLFNADSNISPQVNALPKISLVSEPKDYVDQLGSIVKQKNIDIIGRYISMGKLHRAFAVSGSICLAAACKIPGTIPNMVCNMSSSSNMIQIGHPSGIISVNIEIEQSRNSYTITKGGTGRTARRIMEGNAVVPVSTIYKEAQHYV